MTQMERNMSGQILSLELGPELPGACQAVSKPDLDKNI